MTIVGLDLDQFHLEPGDAVAISHGHPGGVAVPDLEARVLLAVQYRQPWAVCLVIPEQVQLKTPGSLLVSHHQPGSQVKDRGREFIVMSDPRNLEVEFHFQQLDLEAGPADQPDGWRGPDFGARSALDDARRHERHDARHVGR